jgi:hypothetical protein
MTEATDTPVVSIPELLATDRCDSCSAAAQIRATLLNGELLFCGHHARKNHEALVKVALTIYDPFDNLPDIIAPHNDEGNENG